MVLYFILLIIFSILCGIALFNIIYYLPKIYKLVLQDKINVKVFFNDNKKGNNHVKK